MTRIETLDDLRWMRESVDLECKLAAGRDGQGAVPEDFWKTYSAFANTHGGVVVFGVREKNGVFFAEGVPAPDKVRKDLFNTLNNPGKVSVNLLSDASVQECVLDGKTLLIVDIPRAPRESRPVYLNGQMLRNTYRRMNDGDFVASDEWVKRLLAEQVEESRDNRVLRGYDLADLAEETLRDYRRIFTNRAPTHPFNSLPDLDFLRRIGGYAKNRETGDEGLTAAGLLMFGRMDTIQQAFPYYMLDYRERPEAVADARWIDRITLDGLWSGNLFDFYRKVYLKLTAEVKVPFVLEGGERRDETSVHVALREALANTLIHADYSDRASILVVKRPDWFGFRNPGLMRIPVADAYRGNASDCRNRTLAAMFRHVGIGDQAGSGLPKILQGWRDQHWRPPALAERTAPFDQTILELRMIDLLPAETLAGLRARFPTSFEQLPREDRLILATVATENTTTHARLLEVTGLHPVDLSRHLQRLVTEAFLSCDNPGRASVYHLAGDKFLKPEDIFADRPAPSSALLDPSSALLDPSSALLDPSSALLAADIPSAAPTGGRSGPARDGHGRIVHPEMDAPVVESLSDLIPAMRETLETLAAEPRAKGKLPPERMRDIILALCRDQFLSLPILTELLRREGHSLRQHHLKPLIDAGRLRLAFPTVPTHPKQAYRAV